MGKKQWHHLGGGARRRGKNYTAEMLPTGIDLFVFPLKDFFLGCNDYDSSEANTWILPQNALLGSAGPTTHLYLPETHRKTPSPEKFTAT